MEKLECELKIGSGVFLSLTILGLVGYSEFASLLNVVDRSGKADDMQVIVKNILEARRQEKNLIIRKKAVYRDKTQKAIAVIKKQALATKNRFRQVDNKKL